MSALPPPRDIPGPPATAEPERTSPAPRDSDTDSGLDQAASRFRLTPHAPAATEHAASCASDAGTSASAPTSPSSTPVHAPATDGASRTPAPDLDAAAYPHIVDRIAFFAPPPTILAVASTSRALRAHLLPKLYAHVSLLTARDDTFTLRSAAGTSFRGHRHRPAGAWALSEAVSGVEGDMDGGGHGHPVWSGAGGRDAPPPRLPPLLPGHMRVLDLHPGKGRGLLPTSAPAGVLALVAPTVVRLRLADCDADEDRPRKALGHFMEFLAPRDASTPAATPASASNPNPSPTPVHVPAVLVVMVERDSWFIDSPLRFDAPIPTAVVHFCRAWCTGYRQNPTRAIPSLAPLPRGEREIVLIFDYLDGVQLHALVPALASVVADACRPHSAPMRITIVGDTGNAGWLAGVVSRMRAKLGEFEDDRVEFDGTCPLELVSRAEYAARVGAERWAVETDAAYRYVG